MGINFVELKDTHKALKRLNELIKEKWIWKGVIHNCFTFTREILSSGGYELRNHSCYFAKLNIELPIQFYEETDEKNFVKFYTDNIENIYPKKIICDTCISSLEFNKFDPYQKIILLLYILNHFSEICNVQKEKFYNENLESNIEDDDFVIINPKESEKKYFANKEEIICEKVSKKLLNIISNILTNIENYKNYIGNENFITHLENLSKYLNELYEGHKNEKNNLTFFNPKTIEEKIQETFNSLPLMPCISQES